MKYQGYVFPNKSEERDRALTAIRAHGGLDVVIHDRPCWTLRAMPWLY